MRTKNNPAILIALFGFCVGLVCARLSAVNFNVDQLEMMSFNDLMDSHADDDYKWTAFLYMRGEWGMCSSSEEIVVLENRKVCVSKPRQFMEIQ